MNTFNGKRNRINFAKRWAHCQKLEMKIKCFAIFKGILHQPDKEKRMIMSRTQIYTAIFTCINVLRAHERP